MRWTAASAGRLSRALKAIQALACVATLLSSQVDARLDSRVAGSNSFGFNGPAPPPSRPSCPPGQVPVEKPEGTICMTDFSMSWGSRETERKRQKEVEQYTPLPPRDAWGPQPKSPEQRRRPVDGWVFEPDVPSAPASYPLPHLDRINFEDERCLSAHQVFWPGDGQCYDLLQRGPCSRDDHWLVLKQKPRSAEVEVVCQKRPCPCNPRDPTLCEVWYEDEAGPCGSHCRVALAAEQDGVCGQGEQLRLTPFGTGVCECRDGHERWGRDQKCYELHTAGPCGVNETYVYSPPMQRPFCVPALCDRSDMVLFDDGRCYFPGSRGPCGPGEHLAVDARSKEPVCEMILPSQVKRIFDMAPNHLSKEHALNSILGSLKASSGMAVAGGCEGDACFNEVRRSSEGSKRGKKTLSTLLKRAREERTGMAVRAKKYLQYLRSFRKKYSLY